MNGIVFVESATTKATAGHMLLTFKSGGDAFRFHLPAHLALVFAHAMVRDACQNCGAPGADIIKFSPKNKRKSRS